MNLNEKFLLSIVLIFLTMPASIAQNNISGFITSEEGGPIENVLVSISGSSEGSVLSDENGYYEFSVQSEGDYTITPCSNADILNGVSTLDRVIITKHLDGQEDLDTPYKIIAADVDHDNNLTPKDTLILTQIILGGITEFPNNMSWRFIEKSFAFPDPTNPFTTVFPEIGLVSNLVNDTMINFIGLKVGDVTHSSNLTLSVTTEGCSVDIVSNKFLTGKQNEVKVFPNPFKENFTISLGQQQEQIILEVYSSMGHRVVQHKYFSTHTITLELGDISAGGYFVKLITSNGAQCISMIKT